MIHKVLYAPLVLHGAARCDWNTCSMVSRHDQAACDGRAPQPAASAEPAIIDDSSKLVVIR